MKTEKIRTGGSKSTPSHFLTMTFPGNEESLRKIDSALYVINLDDSDPADLLKMAPIGLHGDAANR